VASKLVGFSALATVRANLLADYWALMKPEYVSSIVVICGSAKTSDHNYAFLEGPTSALLNASDFPAYREDKTQKPLQGLTALGKVWAPWLFSAEWFREKNFEKMGHKDFAAYLAESEKTL
jgi:homoserine acetyltransferase